MFVLDIKVVYKAHLATMWDNLYVDITQMVFV